MADLELTDSLVSKTRGDANLRMSLGLANSSQTALDFSASPGLIGQFFTGSWRATISTGNIGTLPLSAPTTYSSISYSSIGDNYGFIAIGYFKPPTTGTYTFFTSSDDYSGVWVGNRAATIGGRTAANATVNNGMDLGSGGQSDTKRSGSVALTAGVWYAIRIVHEEGGGGDNLTFSWSGPGIAETTNLSQYFRIPVTFSGQTISNYSSEADNPVYPQKASSLSVALETISFTSGLRERLSAKSSGVFNATDISSDGQLAVSNTLVAESTGSISLSVEATVTSLVATATSDLRERLRFGRLLERLNASSLATETLNFTTRLREIVSAESSGIFNGPDISSEGQLVVSNTLVARSGGSASVSVEATILQLEATAKTHLRERISFGRIFEVLNATSSATELLNFSTRIRERLNAISSGQINAVDVSSDGQLAISNTLVAKSGGNASVSVEAVVLQLEAIASPNLRERLNFSSLLFEVAQGVVSTREALNFTARLRERLNALSTADLIGFARDSLLTEVVVARSSGSATLSPIIDIAGVELRLIASSSGRERINWAQSISEAKDTITAQAVSYAQDSLRAIYRERLRADVSSSGTIALEATSRALRLTLNAESDAVETLDFTRNIENTLTARVNAIARLRFSTDAEVFVVNARTSGRIATRSTGRITSERAYAISDGGASILVEANLDVFIGWGIPI